MNDAYISREEVLNLIDTAFESGAFDGRYAYENLIDAVQNLIHPLETDLVSRQAVIDTIETDCSWDIFNEWGSRTPTGESIIEAIKSVPSVEPEKCGDCISRESALEILDDYAEDIESGNWGTAYSKARTSMCDLPSVTPKRKPGKWIHMVGFWECDQCHAEYTDMPTCMGKVIYEYCPMCGSKMEVDNG